MPTVISASNHAAVDSDQEYFRLNPDRIFRARPYVAGEFGVDPRLVIFVPDDNGRSQEVNTVIVKRFAGFLIRLPIFTTIQLDDDGQIVDFLRSRGIDSDTMQAAIKPAAPWGCP